MQIKKNVTKVKFTLYTKDILVLNKMNYYFSPIHLKFINKISFRKEKKNISLLFIKLIKQFPQREREVNKP